MTRQDFCPELIHPEAQAEDLRYLWGYIDVPDVAGSAARSLASLGGGGVHIVHPVHGALSWPDDLPGVRFHPGRGKWIVLYEGGAGASGPAVEVQSPLLRRHQIEPDRRLVHLLANWTKAEPGLCLRFPKNAVEFIDVRDVFSKYLLTFSAAASADGGAEAAAVPLKAAFWDLADLPAGIANPSQKAGKIEVRLFGDVPVALSYSAGFVTPLGAGALEVWPDVPSADWRLQWLSAYFPNQGADSATATPLVERQVRFDGGRAWVLERSQNPAPSAIDITDQAEVSMVMVRDRVRAAGIEAGDAEGLFVVGRSQRDPVFSAPAAATEARVSIDFGTSRSALLVDGGLDGADVEPLQTRALRQTRGWEEHWIYFMTPVPTGRGSAPPPGTGQANGKAGQLVVESKLTRRRRTRGTVPFVDYTIRPNDVLPKQLEQSYEAVTGGAESSGVGQGALKWDPARAKERSQYLTCLVLMGVAEAAARFGTMNIALGYSYPLAFDGTLLQALQRDFDAAVAEARTLTGCTITVTQPVTESLAGLSALGQAGGNWLLTIDVGGGTTDFGLWDALANGTGAPLAVDSVEFAGDLLLTTAGVVGKGRDAAQVRMHRGEFLEYVLSDQRTKLSDEFREYVDAVALWSEWLIDYAARLVAGTVINQVTTNRFTKPKLDLRVVLLGGGWNALDALTQQTLDGGFRTDTQVHNRLQASLEARINELLSPDHSPGIKPPAVSLFQLGVGILQQRREKLAVAQGIFAAQGRTPASGIVGPNGLAERRDGQVVPWFEMAGLAGGTSYNSNPDLLPSPPLPETEGILDDLAKPGSNMSSQIRNSLNKLLKSGTGPTSRHRTALSIVYREVLGPHLSGDGS